MRIVFMGSPEFAVPALTALQAAGHEILAVYCQPPRPAGRGHQPQPCAVQIAAERLGIPVRHPTRLRGNAEALAAFQALRPETAVVAAYGLILPPEWLAVPGRGCINIHASLLPRWRGAAPIHAAILAGDTETGVTIMRMDAGLDTGPMLLVGRLPIGPRSRLGEVHDALASLGARLVCEVLDNNPPTVAQPAEGATYAPRLSRADGRIEWEQPAAQIERQIRAFDPWPGAFTTFGAETLKLLDAEVVTSRLGPPGIVLDDRLTVSCGEGALRILRLQRAGRAPTAADAFLRGFAIPVGTRLGPE
jgi:methionyl-tRNA formyltransferase